LDDLQLSSKSQGGFVIVAVGGELDVVTSHQFDEYLAQARGDHKRVIIDLSAVDFMDTGSLAVIVGHWKALTTAGGTLLLAGARYRYTKTLWITGLAERLPLYDTVEEALAAGTETDGGEKTGDEDAGGTATEGVKSA
jgi:stage II sporulation protein AA (anti-sigma F factor antagonist)